MPSQTAIGCDVVVEFGEHVKDFHTHVIFATNAIVNRHPDRVRRFLAGWRDVIDFMAANREETIRLVVPVSGLPEDIQRNQAVRDAYLGETS